jgi:anti-anti-sigma regulatory factor
LATNKARLGHAVTLVLPKDIAVSDRGLIRLAILTSQKNRILLDASKVRRFDRWLLDLVVELEEPLAKVGKSVRFIGTSKRLRRTLEAAHMLHYLESMPVRRSRLYRTLKWIIEPKRC